MNLHKDNAPGRVLHDWWHEVTQERDKGSARAARAILRRAHGITAVTLTQPYQHLFQRMRAVQWNEKGYPSNNDALAAVAGLLVHVEADNSDRLLAHAMGQCPEGSTRPYVSEARFKRLLEAPDLDTLFTSLRRTLPLMSGGVPVFPLANDVLDWAWPEQRDEVKKRWAYSFIWPRQDAT
jgi:CRISPR system Cascade subunit CasB